MLEAFDTSWAVALSVFGAVALGVVCVALLWEGLRRVRQQREVARRLAELSRRTPEADSARPTSEVLRGDEEERGWVGTVLRFVPRHEDLRVLLDQADSSWSAGVFLLLTLGLTAATGLSASILLGSTAGALLAAAAGGAVPYLWLRRRRTKRYEAFEEAFPDAVELLGRSLRAGHAFLTGLEVVAEEAPGPVDREFRQVFEEQKFGLPLNESLLGLADRVDTVDVRMFATSVMIQRESGGNLAEILDNLAQLIRERFKFRRQLRVHTAQGRMTGYLLALLPIAVGLILLALNREYMIVLFEEPAGRMLLMATGVLQVLGFLWIRRIVNIEF